MAGKFIYTVAALMTGGLVGGAVGTAQTSSSEHSRADLEVTQKAAAEFKNLEKSSADVITGYSGSNPVVRAAVIDCYRPPNTENAVALKACFDQKARAFTVFVAEPLVAREHERKVAGAKLVGLGMLAGTGAVIVCFAAQAARRRFSASVPSTSGARIVRLNQPERK